MVMALEMCRVMVGLSLMAFWYSVEQSVSVKPVDIAKWKIEIKGALQVSSDSVVCSKQVCYNTEDKRCNFAFHEQSMKLSLSQAHKYNTGYVLPS